MMLGYTRGLEILYGVPYVVQLRIRPLGSDGASTNARVFGSPILGLEYNIIITFSLGSKIMYIFM